jgi:membrane protein required for beta-lactamase induction
MKIDTEGNELNVLRGAERLLRASDPLIVVEINRFGMAQLGTDDRELRAWLAALGFDAYVPRQTVSSRASMLTRVSRKSASSSTRP